MTAILAGCPRLGGCRPAKQRRHIPLVAAGALLVGLLLNARALAKTHRARSNAQMLG